MAVTYSVEDDCYFGYSTDIKPMNVKVNSKFYEYDTRLKFIFTSTEWVEAD